MKRKMLRKKNKKYDILRGRFKYRKFRRYTSNQVDKILISDIINKSPIKKIETIRNSDLEDLEEKIGIRPTPPKIYFKWEKGEKIGWQFREKKFVSKKELMKRDNKVSHILTKNK